MYLAFGLSFLASIFLAIYLSEITTLDALISLFPVAKPAPLLPTTSVPAFWNTYGYLFNITVGTPPQNLTVLSDWAWMSLFARSSRCVDTVDPALCVAPGQSYYDERLSSTFSPSALPQLQWPTNLFCPLFTVDYISDTVCINDLCTEPTTTFQASHFPFTGEWVPVQPFGGIFGMAPVLPELNETFHPVFHQAWQSGKTNPQIGWNACKDLSSTEPCLGGDSKFVFGGSDPSLYHTTNLTWYKTITPPWLGGEMYAPISPQIYNFWSTRWTGGWIVSPPPSADPESQTEPETETETWSPNYAIRFPPSALIRNAGPEEWQQRNPHAIPESDGLITPLAVLDDNSEGLGVPVSANAYNDFIRLVDARKASPESVAALAAQMTSSPTGAHAQDWYLVDCDAAETLPSLVYELDHRVNYTVRPEAFVQEIYATGECYLNLNVWTHSRTESGDATLLSLGLGFLKSLYVILDFETLEFGLAPLRLDV
ncbi:hypothetical protein BO70DRAFT_353399 [Aspergillus heteromorphus CBS 117.55]|uniref:Peptidase A1 domain-containing protein n=1 Tax=Aspergillus heteromorphus CBS 117.55 TaxID=1448321 RepID=A0A317W363_9EURO|nr:uncharacterized protein BO70DRAFT_353399 [Aspergillus heteromorphus CBS 117.55]PWY79687.1 hypothetical protein BO70DRAFT_353399 [Aspergillus heteromorphus CBS 117.55]